MERREELLEKIIDVLLTGGVADLSLRPLAKAVGTSARLLIYHFESKEKLLTDALELVRDRVDTSLRDLATKEDPQSLEAFLLMFWSWAMQEPHQRYFRLLFEIDGLALQNRDRFPKHFWGAGFTRWRHALETEFSQLSDEDGGAASTFVLATLSGLLHDFLATGDRKRTTDALHCLIEKISNGSGVGKKYTRAVT